MLSDILPRVAKDTGYHTTDNRVALLDLINRAAEQVYKMLECDNVLRETTLVVPPDKIVALPSFVGPLKGTRAHNVDIPFDRHALAQPRYTENTGRYLYTNWRELGVSSIHTSLSAVSKLTLITPTVEATPAIVTISGETADSDRINEAVTMDSVSEDTVKSFGPTIHSISSASARLYNITIYDASANELAVLKNTEYETKYKLVDVSTVFWGTDTSAGETLIDVLFKVPFCKFVNDTDKFAADGYDDAVYYFAMSLFFLPQQGKENIAIGFRSMAIAEISKINQHLEGKITKKVIFGRNPIYNYFRRVYQNAIISRTV